MGRFLAVTIAFLYAVAVHAAGMPGRFESINPSRQAPVWIGAKEALAADGTLRDAAVSGSEQRALRGSLEKARERVPSHTLPQASSQCGVTVARVEEGVSDMGSAASWEALAALLSTRTVYEGRVTGTDVGLYAGVPFTVVQLEATGGGVARYLYLLLPKGELRINGMRVCTSDPNYPEVPGVGTKIAFIAGTAVDKTGVLFRVPPERIFYETEGALVVAPRFRDEPAFKRYRSLAGLLRALGEATPTNPRREH
jgi:hypothetical protein